MASHMPITTTNRMQNKNVSLARTVDAGSISIIHMGKVSDEFPGSFQIGCLDSGFALCNVYWKVSI